MSENPSETTSIKAEATPLPEAPLPLETIHDLRACLPDLKLDPHSDSLIPLPFLAERYLQFYNLVCPAEFFHRWGRVVLPPYTIASHYWLPNVEGRVPEKGMVIVVHGYFDHVGLYGHLIRYLLGLGYGVVAFDLPGHGLSSGERASIATFDHYVGVLGSIIERVCKAFGSPVSAIGQSTGGAILLRHLALRGGENLQKITLLAPLVAPAMWWLNKAVYALSHKHRSGVKRKFTSNSSDESFLQFLKEKDPLQSEFIPIAWLGAMKQWVAQCREMPPCNYPLTIIQGKKDKTLSWRSNLKLLDKKFPNSRVVLIEDAQHHIVNESKTLRESIFPQMGF